MSQEIDKERWIEIGMGVNTSARGLINFKKRMEEYAKEVDWELSAEKEGHIDEEGEKMYNLHIAPKGKKISPEEFRRIKDKLTAFTQELAESIRSFYDADGRLLIRERWGPLNNILSLKKKEDMMMFITKAEILNLSYPLIKRVELEKENPSLAKGTFGDTLNQEWNNYENIKITFLEKVFKKDLAKTKEESHNKLKEWFGIIIE